MSIIARYDESTGAVSIDFGCGGQVTRTVRIDDCNLVDLDSGGEPVGLEILDLRRARINEAAGKFGFSDRVGEIMMKIAMVVPASTDTSTGMSFTVRWQRSSSAGQDDTEGPEIVELAEA